MAIESFINSFDKGMTKDYNVYLQPDGTYRHCVNCSLVSQDGNNYVIKDCLGNVKTFTLNRRYGQYSTLFDTAPTPIGFISFPDTLVTFSTNDNTENGGYGEIGRIDYLPYGEGVMPLAVAGQYNSGYTPLYHSSDLKFTILQQIEGFAFQETDDIKNIYWTDDFNEPRVLNIANPIYTTYIASGSLITGNQYMVLEGIITHNGVDYGPTDGSGGVGFPGNVFTAVNANYTSVTGTAPTPKVIAYMPYQLLSFTPSRSLGNIKFNDYGSGSLYCGLKMYFYRLTSTSESVKTSWSYGSSPITVRLGDPSDYFADLGAGTPTSLVISDKSVILDIDNIDLNFDRIQVAVAEFDQLLDVPRNIAIVIDEPITGASMQLEHSSNNNLGTLTLNDLTLFPASILTCKTMTTNKNYSLLGNITERAEIVFDNSGITIEQIDYAFPAHRNEPAGSTSFIACDNVMTFVPITYNPGANPVAIEPYTRWIVTDVSGGNVTYNAVSYGIGEVIVGVAGVFAVTIPAGSQIRACVSRNRYTTSGGDPVPDAILLKSGYWDYKDPAVVSHAKGYWNEERYRLGIMFFDLKGNPFYVRHLGDIDTTRQVSKDIIVTVNDVAYINQTGIKVSGITIPPSIISQISGFSIVRAERDKRVLTQGMLMQTSLSTEVISGYTVIQPCSCSKLSMDQSPGSNPKYYSYICPDSMVQFPIPNYKDGLTSGNVSIEEAFWIDVQDQTTGVTPLYQKSVGGALDEFETKYFTVAPAESPVQPLRKESIRSQFNAVENQNIASFVDSGIFFQNNTRVNSTPGAIDVEPYCNSGVTNTIYNVLPDSKAVGGLRTVLELNEDTMTDYNQSSILYSSLPDSQYRKLMMNYVVENSNQYGGNSDAALAATNYISTGHFQPIDAAFLADTFDGTNYVVNDVEIFGGDCFTCLIDYGYGTYNDAATNNGVPTTSYSWGIKFPCQCNANYTLRNGVPSRKCAPDFMHSNSAGNGIFYKIGVNSQLEGFQYNQGYSSDGNFVSYPALPLNYSTSNVFKYRIRFGGQKFPGELLNSFRTYLTNDYKDTDGQGGEINNLRTKDGRTIVWQNAIISTVPILERQLISGLDGAETTLGTGGVVDRFDPIDSYFGNQHQWGLTTTEYGFAWFDMRRKAFVTLGTNQGIIEVSKVEGLKGFFDEAFVEVSGSSSIISNNLLNDPTFSKYSDRPLTGVGICGVYDPKFKMTYLTFKFINRDSVGNELNKDFTIGYYHPQRQFIGFFDWTPGISWNHGQIVLSSNNPKNKTKSFNVLMSPTVFTPGDVVAYLGSEYINYNTVTINIYPGTGTTVPDAAASAYWYKINTTNELWVHNQPKLLGQNPAPDYLYNSFFGQVISNELEFVVNPKVENAFSVLNIEQEGNTENFTDLYISAEAQSASDLSITSTNRFYRKIYDKITSNLPFDVKGRIVNSYLVVRWVKKNWSSDPRVVSTGVKILRYVKSFFSQKR